MQTLGEKAEAALRVVREAKEIAYDVETSGLEWQKHHPVGYVITGGPDCNYYIPVRHGGGGNLNDPHCGPLTERDAKTAVHGFERELAAAFEERRRRGYLTIGHNLKFDMHMSANVGIYLGRECEDTQVNAAMLDEFARSYSLANTAIAAKVTAKKIEEIEAYLIQTFGESIKQDPMGHFWRLSGQDPMAIEYATGDGITTLELAHKQREWINDDELSLIHSVESRLIWTIFRMERRGIKVDEKYIEALVKATLEEIDKARAKLPCNFNERSGPQMRKLFEDAGITNWPMTEPSSKFPNGQPSFTEKFLKQSELGRAVIAVRQLTNLNNTFVTPLRERHIFEGRVHANLHQLKADEYGTVTGRFSCSHPNLQAIHKRNKELGRKFRRIFVADRGMEFYEGDYKQCEPVLFTHYSKEPSLIEAYSADPPRDMHHVVAEMFGVERDPTAKRMNMGILTGMQPRTFAGHMGWDLETATNAHNQWFENFPGIRQFQNQAKAVFRSRGYVKTILGRRARLDDVRFAYRAVSRIIQGSNADIIKERMLRCDEYLEAEGDQSHLLMTVHDSLEWQSPRGALGERQSAEIVRICKDVRGAPFNLRVPLGMDVGHGPDWATATYGPEEKKIAA